MHRTLHVDTVVDDERRGVAHRFTRMAQRCHFAPFTQVTLLSTRSSLPSFPFFMPVF